MHSKKMNEDSDVVHDCHSKVKSCKAQDLAQMLLNIDCAFTTCNSTDLTYFSHWLACIRYLFCTGRQGAKSVLQSEIKFGHMVCDM